MDLPLGVMFSRKQGHGQVKSSLTRLHQTLLGNPRPMSPRSLSDRAADDFEALALRSMSTTSSSFQLIVAVGPKLWGSISARMKRS
jgi:hypothetical protein